MNPSSSEQLEKKNTNEKKKKNPRLRNSRKAFVFLLKKTCEKKKTFRTLCLGGELSEKNFGRKKQKPFEKKKLYKETKKKKKTF